MKITSSVLSCFAFFLFLTPLSSIAAPKEIRLKYNYQHFILSNPEKYLQKTEISTTAIKDPFCQAEDITFTKDETSVKKTTSNVDIIALEEYLNTKVAPKINQQKNDVRIYKNEKGNIQFDGYAQEGITLMVPDTAKMIAFAIENNIEFVNMEVRNEEPNITVENEDLKNMGIKELVAVGRSDFSGSSGSRVHNVMTGANRFNGYIIPKDATFSFTDRLGRVDGSSGYVKELVILGQKVIPDYGGGLCQVSSTAYRGAMLAGMEIVERHNHSYAVRYYEPAGSDATIYVGSKDFKFKNTSEGALLMQTRRGGNGNAELFFHYYGTKPQREVHIFGPIISNYRKPPAPKTTISNDLAPGQVQVVSHEVTGFDSVFFREVKEKGSDLYNDKFFSPYQARGVWTIKGAAAAPVENAEVGE